MSVLTIRVTGCHDCPFLGHGAGNNSRHKHCAYPDHARQGEITDSVRDRLAASGCPLFRAPARIVLVHPATLYKVEDES